MPYLPLSVYCFFLFIIRIFQFLFLPTFNVIISQSLAPATVCVCLYFLQHSLSVAGSLPLNSSLFYVYASFIFISVVSFNIQFLHLFLRLIFLFTNILLSITLQHLSPTFPNNRWLLSPLFTPFTKPIKSLKPISDLFQHHQSIPPTSKHTPLVSLELVHTRISSVLSPFLTPPHSPSLSPE